MSERGPWLLAIDEHNETLHVGPPRVLRDHLVESRPSDAGDDHRRADSAADRQETASHVFQVYDADGQELSAAPSAERAELFVAGGVVVPEAELLARIDTALGHLQELLTTHPELGDAGPDEPRSTRVPRPQGSLHEVLAELATEFGLDEHDPKDKGNFLHMLAHAAGVAHH